MREINEVIYGAKQVVNGIYEQIGRIDSCNAVLKVMDDAEVTLLREDGELVDTSSALTVGQRTDILYNMRRMIKDNIEDAAAALEAVQNAEKADVPVDTTAGNVKQDTAAVQDMSSENVKAAVAEETEDAEQPHDAPEKPKSKRKSRLDKDKVLQMLKDGYSVQEIAREYGYKTTNAVDNFCKENKINIQLYVQNSSRQLTAEDIPQIKALYTDGSFNLTETAAELNVSKKQLRAFVEENHLVKPVAD